MNDLTKVHGPRIFSAQHFSILVLLTSKGYGMTVVSPSDVYSVDACQELTQILSKDPVVSLSKILYLYYLVLAHSRKGFIHDFCKPNCFFHNQTKINQYKLVYFCKNIVQHKLVYQLDCEWLYQTCKDSHYRKTMNFFFTRYFFTIPNSRSSCLLTKLEAKQMTLYQVQFLWTRHSNVCLEIFSSLAIIFYTYCSKVFFPDT